MAEMSFGRPSRAPIIRDEKPVLDFGNPVAFLQGCVAARPTAIDEPALVVDFPDRPAKMLAAVLPDYGPASRLKVQLIDLPRLPLGKLKSSEVVVEVHAASVNPTDWKQRKGTLSQICPLSLPTILGIDLAGRVVRAGDESRLSEGDEVFGRQTLDRMRELNGSYSEYVIVDGADLYRKPPNLSMKEAAAVPHACLAAYAALGHVGKLVDKRREENKSCFILGGSGGVGTFAVQLAKKHFGCYVVASCSFGNAQLVKQLGADEVLDYTDPGFLQSTGLTKFDVIVDCVGGDDYWQAFKGSLKSDGVYVTLVGNKRYLADDINLDYGNALQIKADYFLRQIKNRLGAQENYHILTGSQVKSSDLPILASLLEQEVIKVVLAQTFLLVDITQAHQLSESHHVVGKIVIDMKGNKGTQAASSQADKAQKDLDAQMQALLARNKAKPGVLHNRLPPSGSVGAGDGYGASSLGGKGKVTFDGFPPPAVGDSPLKSMYMDEDDEDDDDKDTELPRYGAPGSALGKLATPGSGLRPTPVPTPSNDLAARLANLQKEVDQSQKRVLELKDKPLFPPGFGTDDLLGGGPIFATPSAEASKPRDIGQTAAGGLGGTGAGGMGAMRNVDIGRSAVGVDRAGAALLEARMARSLAASGGPDSAGMGAGSRLGAGMGGGLGLGGGLGSSMAAGRSPLGAGDGGGAYGAGGLGAGQRGTDKSLEELMRLRESLKGLNAKGLGDSDDDDMIGMPSIPPRQPGSGPKSAIEEAIALAEIHGPPPKGSPIEGLIKKEFGNFRPQNLPLPPQEQSPFEEDDDEDEQENEMQQWIREAKREKEQRQQQGQAPGREGGIKPYPIQTVQGSQRSQSPPSPRSPTAAAAPTKTQPQPKQADRPPPAAPSDINAAPVGPIQKQGLLRKKKEDHGMFEDPYKLVCACRLQDNILRLRLTHNGEVVGLEEQYPLGEWQLLVRNDKADRFSLMKGTMPAADNSNVISFKADNKADAQDWIQALHGAEEEGAGGAGGLGGGNKKAVKEQQLRERMAGQSAADGKPAGVGIVFKEGLLDDGPCLVVKSLAAGGAAESSGEIEMGDVLVKVDGKDVSTTDKASQLILGPRGSKITLIMKRYNRSTEKYEKFSVAMHRGITATLNK